MSIGKQLTQKMNAQVMVLERTHAIQTTIGAGRMNQSDGIFPHALHPHILSISVLPVKRYCSSLVLKACDTNTYTL